MIGTVRLGLVLKNSSIGLVVLKGQRVIHATTIAGQENPAGVLKAELEARGIRRRKARVGLSRESVFVKTLELPPVVEGNLAQMVAFELERHLPLPVEEVCFDFAEPSRSGEDPVQTLVVAAERRVVDRSLRLLEEANLLPLSLTVAAHDLIALVGRRPRDERVAWLHRAGEEIALLLLEGRQVRLSRSLPWIGDEALAAEIRKSLAVLRWSEVAGLWVSGDGSGELESSPALAAHVFVSPPPFTPAASRAIETLGDAETGLTLLALGVALGPRRAAMNLLPEPLRPRQLSTGQLVSAVNVTVALLLGLSVVFARGYQDRRYIEQLNRDLRRLDPEVRVVEQLNAELERKRQLLATVRALEESTLKPLALLRELTEILPQDAWLTSLSLDPKSVELTGQATAANQLIPLLENSPRLEKVEFASPVTKGRDKEQFRIRASWERGRASP